MMKTKAENYVFLLIPCYDNDCIHPVCKNGKPQSNPVWYEGGPLITVLPLPVPDQSRPWGGTCNKCSKFFAGHFLPPE